MNHNAAAPSPRACPVCGKLKIGLADHMRSKHPGEARARATTAMPAPPVVPGPGGRSAAALKAAEAARAAAAAREDFASRWEYWISQLHVELNVSDVCWREVHKEPGQLILLDPTANSTVGLLSKTNQPSFRPAPEVAKELGEVAERWFMERQARALDATRGEGISGEKTPRKPGGAPSPAGRKEFGRPELHLTDFGWHAPEARDRRHAALQSAVRKLGWEDVLKKLGGCRLTSWYHIHRATVEEDISFVQQLWPLSIRQIDWYIHV